MNTSDKFSLSWKDFQSNTSQSFQTLREEKDFFNVTLVGDDLHQIEAHKVVLSSCSPVMKHLLKSNKHSHPLLYIRGAKLIELQYILDFIYTGEVSIFQEHLNEFLAIAEDLKLKGLTNNTVDSKENLNFQDEYNGSKSPGLYPQVYQKAFENDLVPLEEVTGMLEEKKTDILFTVEEHTEYEKWILAYLC